jgi:diguanylate cyclase (GGDEF)-like protein
LLVTIAPRVVEDDRLIGMVVTLQDVTGELRARHELEQARQRLLHLATHDPLTGLANRARLTEELGRRLDGWASKATPLAVLFCDLDGFKEINDEYGHGVGDAVLAEVGTRLRHRVEDPDLVARFGGDEFVVLTSRTGAELDLLAERLAHTVAEPFPVAAVMVHLGVSVGIATTEPGDTADVLLSRADQAMYAAKSASRA